jgi:hypothetical protein
MEELSLKALNQYWATQATPAEILGLLPATEYVCSVEVVYRGSVLVAISRLRSRSGGIVPSFGEVWGLYAINGPEKMAEHLTGLKGDIHRNKHIGVQCEEMATLLGSDICVRVMLPDSMTDPRDPPPTFLIHVEGEKS